MENNGLVSVCQVASYDAGLLREAVDRHFQRLNLAKLITPGIKVLLKPNLLAGRDPSVCVTTHPAVIQAVADWLRSHGAGEITLADSSGGVYTPQHLRSVYHSSAMDTITGITLNMNVGWQTRYHHDGQVCKSFNLIDPVADAQLIINLSKLKTHGMTTMSGGIKNLFGTIPGLQKPEMHYLYPEKQDFSGMLVDLSTLVAPAVTVIDAIEAMEGEGPASGTVRRMGCLFAANDLYSQDWVAAKAMGIDPMSVDMIRIARERGLFDPEEIRIEGSMPEDIPPFIMPKSTTLLFADRMPGPLRLLEKPAIAVMKRLLHPVPHVVTKLCIGCGRCAESCPPHTIDIVKKKAVIHRDKCIACFCCHEMCPVKAVVVKRKINL